MISVNEGNTPKIEDNSILIQESYANQPIPNNRLPKGMYYSFKNKWVNILLLLTPDIKKIIASNTTTPTWGSITGTLSNQTDLQSALDNKMSSDLTDSHIFVGDATNKATDVAMTGDVTIDNTGATTLANTAVTAGTYGNSTNVPQIVVDSKGRIIGASNVAISGASVTPSALTKTDDTNVTLTLGGTPSTALLQAVSLTLGWTGTLADNRIASAATWNAKQNALGYTPEDVANKATSLTSPDNTKYPTTQAVQAALDLKADISNVSIVLYKSITQTIVTNKTSETSIYSIPLPTDGSSYIIQLFSNAQIATYPGFTQNHRIRCGTYLAPIDGITGANAIGNQTLIFNNQGTTNGAPIYIDRTYIFKGDASGSIYSVQSGVAEIYNTATPATLMSANFTTQHYLYVCFSPVNSGIIQHNFIVINKLKI